ncbi:MAG: hypothetical protein GX442_19720 [Candidatus Riflebacteria bacterium]|nr:hypothetical protein [Candidatus Riflebacteria bacterium]
MKVRLTVVAALAGLLLLSWLHAAGATPLAELDQQLITEIQANHQTVSHKAGLVNTIDRLLDCAAAGRIEVALIGFQQTPDWVVATWQKQEPAAKEVSLSRYRLVLEEGKPPAKTDFYRFRTVREDGVVSEILLQNLPKEKRAAIIFQFEDGDPTGQYKNLAATLEDLLSCIEEGQITMTGLAFTEVPQRVNDLWKANADPRLAGEEVTVQRFEADTPGGIDVYWRLSATTAPGHCEQTMLIFRDRLVFDVLNEDIKTF